MAGIPTGNRALEAIAAIANAGGRFRPVSISALTAGAPPDGWNATARLRQAVGHRLAQAAVLGHQS